MKSTPRDYVMSGLWITLIFCASMLVMFIASPATTWALATYHVFVDLLILMLAYGVISALVVRLLLWRSPIAPGTYDMDSPVFARWKLVTVLYRMGQGALRPVTPFFLLPVLDSLYGAKVGRDIAFGGVIDDPYAVSVGDGVVLGHGSLVSGNYLWDGRLRCGTIAIGDGATIGAHCIVFPDVRIGAGASVMSASVVMPGTSIPSGEIWKGNPARKWSQVRPGRLAESEVG